MVYQYIAGPRTSVLKYVVTGIFLLQVFSGALQVLQPFINPVKPSALSAQWFEGMKYLKEHSEKGSLLAYNRLQLKENYYKDDFDFVPVYAERPVVLGGRQYLPDYEARKASLDTLFSTSSCEQARKVIDEYKISYLVFDKWKGGKLPAGDSCNMQPVFSNSQLAIYKVNPN
jgi:hypothetical protein